MAVSDQRIGELDGVRGIAVLMVLAWHFVGVFIPHDGPINNFIGSLFMFGRTGVDLFFVLSGFLIIGILIDRRQSPNLLRTFYIRRISRIIPPYLLLIAVFQIITSFVVVPGTYFNDSISLGYYLTFTQNWWMAINNDWGPEASSVTWSVSIEEQFYMFFPLIVLFTPPQHLRWVLISVALASAVARAGFYFVYPAQSFAPYVNTVFRMDALCVGGIIALAVRDPATMQYFKKNSAKMSRIKLCLVAVLPLFLWALNNSVRNTMYYWGHSYLTVLYGSLLLSILLKKGTTENSILRWPALKFFGSISYSMYLFHPMIIGIFFMLDGRVESLSSIRDAALLAGAFGVTVIVCWLFLGVAESRFIRFGHTFKYGEVPTSVPVASGR